MYSSARGDRLLVPRGAAVSTVRSRVIRSCRGVFHGLLCAVALFSGCEADPGQPLPAPKRVICLDFSATNFPEDWRQSVFDRMDADFSSHGFRVTFTHLDTCDFHILFGGDDATRWGVAFENRREAQVFTDAILRWADGLSLDAYLQGVANAAAHEMGHLLGYGHATDPTDVMSVSENASVRFFDDQQFYP